MKYRNYIPPCVSILKKVLDITFRFIFDKRNITLPIILTKLNDIPEIVPLFRPQKVKDRSRLSTKSKTNQRRCEQNAFFHNDKSRKIKIYLFANLDYF